VVDLSAEALKRARQGLLEADRIEWVLVDIRDHDFGRRFALWHERAVFHFVVSPKDRSAYLTTLECSLEPTGQVVMAHLRPCGADPLQRPAGRALRRGRARRRFRRSCRARSRRVSSSTELRPARVSNFCTRTSPPRRAADERRIGLRRRSSGEIAAARPGTPFNHVHRGRVVAGRVRTRLLTAAARSTVPGRRGRPISPSRSAGLRGFLGPRAHRAGLASHG
jgi:hypothetical protein